MDNIYIKKNFNTLQECPVTSTLQPTTENVEWLESHVAAGFRIWQIMFLCFACLLTLGNCTLHARWVLHTRHTGTLFFFLASILCHFLSARLQCKP